MITSSRTHFDHLIPTLVAQRWPGRRLLGVEPVPEGVSTYVYRIRYDNETLYLRVLPEVDASLVPEARVHDMLRAQGIQVPAVIEVEASNPIIDRSLMLTTAIEGQPIGYGQRPADVADLLFQAGKALAAINGIPVNGFGWIRRDAEAGARLLGEFATCPAWIQSDIGQVLETLQQTHSLEAYEIAALQSAMAQAELLFSAESAYLAHGDFDPTHIFHTDNRYTGLIDFGEIRGAPALYDLGHFQIENSDLLPYLLNGYAEVRPLPHDYTQQMMLLSLLIAARRVARRALKRPGDPYAPDLAAIRRALEHL